MKTRIVAEVSKNWCGEIGEDGMLLSNKFETVISVNAQRGFALESWQYSQVMTTPNSLHESIVAVFVEDE